MLAIEKQTTASFDVDPQRGFAPLCPAQLPVPAGDEIAPEGLRQAGAGFFDNSAELVPV